MTSTGIETLTPRDVPLGGLRAMQVRRTLPQRSRSLIGAWCFVDHYGPSSTDEMFVAPHPHTGLQTVSWLFAGEIEHRDSVGSVALVRPGEVNLMTAGRGISHSEISTRASRLLHGVQLWVALPDESRHIEPRFEHHAPELVRGDGYRALVFVGSLLGETSPLTTHTPLVGAEIRLDPGADLVLDVDPTFEHGVLVDTGSVTVDGDPVGRYELGYAGTGSSKLRISAGPDPARIVLLGGPPFGESIVMWWNFIGRSHEEVVEYRTEWQRQVAEQQSRGPSDGRFGVVPPDPETDAPEWIPAPTLPNVRLKHRG